ncbi:E3 ubiquitin-protein ligase RNFT1 isoform X2 [Astyanax mexicanus]|uniref:E3 ubiquitin-protein ligase RNFT1 isoform X2 n=1 Tax=Astyanax mexicanus TaxID=7994 RepID=UPI0020CB1AEE|nr:E3 ubiquitin-protein ligase RNFT1 isoform X2 [Astyanax mexicanus]
MKLRPQYERRAFNVSESRRGLKPGETTVMPTELNSQDGSSGLSLALQPEHLSRTSGSGAVTSLEPGDVRVAVGSSAAESSGVPASRRPRSGAHSHAHTHSHGSGRVYTQPYPEAEQSGHEPDTGLAVGVGLFTTFLYVNKNIQTQVFLQDRQSKLQCLWLLSFLIASSLLFYYAFQAESLYYCLILVNPQVEQLDFWEVLWAVGVTSFTVKFVFMGFKCLILLLPSPVMVHRRRGQWYMMIEEVSQVYQVIVPVPPWFRYLVSYRQVGSSVDLTLGVLLALLYLILKLLGLYGQWGSLKKTVRTFLSCEVNGGPATLSQCTEAGDTCPICQSDFKQPRVLLCQFNTENTSEATIKIMQHNTLNLGGKRVLLEYCIASVQYFDQAYPTIPVPDVAQPGSPLPAVSKTSTCYISYSFHYLSVLLFCSVICYLFVMSASIRGGWVSP